MPCFDPALDEDESESTEGTKPEPITPPVTDQGMEALHESMVTRHGLGLVQLLGLAVVVAGAGFGIMKYRSRASSYSHDDRMLA